jgi:hypothetical protein
MMCRSRSKAEIQRAVFLPARGAQRVFAFDPASGDCRKPAEAAVLKDLGGAGRRTVIVVLRGPLLAARPQGSGRPPEFAPRPQPAPLPPVAEAPGRALAGELLRAHASITADKKGSR